MTTLPIAVRPCERRSTMHSDHI